MKKILVIEDNPDNMALIEEILVDEGFEVLEASMAENGISMLKENKADLIIMDISLPKMSGLEATRIIKEDDALKNIPVIALTAHAMASDREKAMSAGCDGFLAKPVDEAELLKMINHYIRGQIQ